LFIPLLELAEKFFIYIVGPVIDLEDMASVLCTGAETLPRGNTLYVQVLMTVTIVVIWFLEHACCSTSQIALPASAVFVKVQAASLPISTATSARKYMPWMN